MDSPHADDLMAFGQHKKWQAKLLVAGSQHTWPGNLRSVWWQPFCDRCNLLVKRHFVLSSCGISKSQRGHTYIARQQRHDQNLLSKKKQLAHVYIGLKALLHDER